MNISVNLLHCTPLAVGIGAIRQCYESGGKSDSITGYDPILCKETFQLGDRDKALVEHIIKLGHTSTLEHIAFNFQIRGISRLNLQELARHRHASLSVKSTRYTLKELKGETSFIEDAEGKSALQYERASKFINLLGDSEIDEICVYQLNNLWQLVQSGRHTNDEIKYALPECYRLDLFWTINARSLMNFLSLRTSSAAHFEIRELAWKIYWAIPLQYRFIFDKYVHVETVAESFPNGYK